MLPMYSFNLIECDIIRTQRRQMSVSYEESFTTFVSFYKIS